MSAGLVAGASLSAWPVRRSNAAEAAQGAAVGELKPGEIQHMVIFNLKREKNSLEALDSMNTLRNICGSGMTLQTCAHNQRLSQSLCNRI